MISQELKDFETGYIHGLLGDYSPCLATSRSYRAGHQKGAIERVHRYLNGGRGRTPSVRSKRFP